MLLLLLLLFAWLLNGCFPSNEFKLVSAVSGVTELGIVVVALKLPNDELAVLKL